MGMRVKRRNGVTVWLIQGREEGRQWTAGRSKDNAGAGAAKCRGEGATVLGFPEQLRPGGMRMRGRKVDKAVA